MLNIVVIGLGSMGKRRIRLLKEIDNNITIYGVDKNKERCIEAGNKYAISTFTDLQEVFVNGSLKLNAAIISTSPLSHASIISKCLDAGLHVFTELNLVDNGYQENIKKAAIKEKTLFLSSTFLYRDEIQYIYKKVKECESLVNYSYHVGQYLPDWHPWENYKDFFVNDKRTNGCRELFAIEFPWLQKIFGKVKSFYSIKGKTSKLDIDYVDTYHLLLCHENGNMGSLQLDVVSRKAVRKLEVYSDDIYLTWNGTPENFKIYNHITRKCENVNLFNDVYHIDEYNDFIVENAYQNELLAFLNEISGKKCARYNFEEDIETLNLISRIEKVI